MKNPIQTSSTTAEISASISIESPAAAPFAVACGRTDIGQILVSLAAVHRLRSADGIHDDLVTRRHAGRSRKFVLENGQGASE